MLPNEQNLEGDFGRIQFFVGVPPFHPLPLVARSTRTSPGIVSTIAVSGAAILRTAAAQQRQIMDEYLRPVALLPGFLVIPRARLDLALDEELRALAHIIAHDLRGPAVSDQVVPLGPVGPIALTVLLPVGSRERKADGKRAARCSSDLGILANVPEQKCSIYALCHGGCSFPSGL